MKKHIAGSSAGYLLPRCARILKPGTYGSLCPLPSRISALSPAGLW